MSMKKYNISQIEYLEEYSRSTGKPVEEIEKYAIVQAMLESLEDKKEPTVVTVETMSGINCS